MVWVDLGPVVVWVVVQVELEAEQAVWVEFLVGKQLGIELFSLEALLVGR